MMKKYKVSWLSQAIIRFVMVVLLVAISLCFALMQGGFVSWFVFFMFIPFALYSMILFFVPVSNFSIERTMLSEYLKQGDSLRMTITLRRKSRFPLLYMVIQESMPSEIFEKAAADQTRHFFMVGLKKQIAWNYEIPNMPRGHHQLVGIELTIADFFGWVKKTTFIPANRSVVVYPNITNMIYTPLQVTRNSGIGTAHNAIVRDTTMVSGIREYQPGDRMAWIHWKTFAKTQSLQTKEFEDQQSQDICLVLDESPSDVFEEQVELCASILTAVVHQHFTMSFLSAGTKPAFFDQIQTEEQLQKALYYLAAVQPNATEEVARKYDQNRLLIHAAMLYFVTGALTIQWITILKKISTKSQQVICFIVRDPKTSVSEHEEKVEMMAKENGILVFPISHKQFPNAFTEVLK